MNKDIESFFIKIGNWGCKLSHDVIEYLNFTGETGYSFYKAVLNPKRIRWRETLYYMDNCGSDALPIVVVVGFLVGFVLAVQGVNQLESFGAKMMVMNLVILSIFKELGPIMTAVVATGRAGSSFAAEIGTMIVTEEIDAMRVMGFEINRFLVIPKLIAMMLIMPILTILGNIAAVIGGIAVVYVMNGQSIPECISIFFNVLHFSDYMQSLIKSIVFGIIIACVGCMRGFQAKRDSQSVGRCTTSSVVTSIFILAVADTIISMMFCYYQ